jgi:hypothetical protein
VTQADTTSTRTSLWFAFLAGPIAWSLHELLTYVLVRVACNLGLLILEYIVTLVTLGVCVAGVYVAIRVHGGEIRPPETTAEFITLAGAVLNILFALAIVMESIPTTVLSPCL